MPAEGRRAAIGAVTVLATVLGLWSGIAGIWSQSFVVFLNTLGVLSIGTVVGGAIGQAGGDDKVEQVKWVAVGAVIGAAISGTIFALGRGLEGDERSVNALTLMGAALIVAALVGGVYAYNVLTAAAEPKRKKCPDCANMVLEEARKCQFCSYRWR